MIQWQVYDRRFPWIQWAHHPEGFVMRDTRRAGKFFASSWDGVVSFAADRSTPEGKTGLGNLVKGVTGLFGVERCTPCAERQAEMNQWVQFPSSWNPFS
jgi:hypothetical protein